MGAQRRYCPPMRPGRFLLLAVLCLAANPGHALTLLRNLLGRPRTRSSALRYSKEALLASGDPLRNLLGPRRSRASAFDYARAVLKEARPDAGQPPEREEAD